MTRMLIVVAVSTVLLVALGGTGEAKSTPQEKGLHRAHVLSDGSFQSHSKDVLAVGKTSTGVYQITMKKALDNCAVTATNSPDGNANGGSIEAYIANTVSPTIVVYTFTGGGSVEDRDFFVIVACTR